MHKHNPQPVHVQHVKPSASFAAAMLGQPPPDPGKTIVTMHCAHRKCDRRFSSYILTGQVPVPVIMALAGLADQALPDEAARTAGAPLPDPGRFLDSILGPPIPVHPAQAFPPDTRRVPLAAMIGHPDDAGAGVLYIAPVGADPREAEQWMLVCRTTGMRWPDGDDIETLASAEQLGDGDVQVAAQPGASGDLPPAPPPLRARIAEARAENPGRLVADYYSAAGSLLGVSELSRAPDEDVWGAPLPYSPGAAAYAHIYVGAVHVAARWVQALQPGEHMWITAEEVAAYRMAAAPPPVDAQ